MMLARCSRTLYQKAPILRAFSSTLPNGSEKPFDKILIANRGEIACRVMKTAKKMGIKTVAVYSEPDGHAVHVKMADEAVCIGPAASAESYLSIPNIIDAIKKTGAQAVHPGYGFLSENSQFVEALEKEGVSFVGPGSFAMEAMGDKITSKQLAIDAGVNTIPGFQGVISDGDEAVKIAREIGYPVMIKASAGGGGKGMRVAFDDESARLGFRLSKDEAASSFGDDRCFIEKYIEEPRHIEIQLLGDKHGNYAAFPERECSVQRRNQKVVEESPSMLLDEETRAAMCEQAIMLAKAVNYHSAGTVEFLCDKHKNFYFLEMNTRLQVEHPITECVSGEDLVEHMLNIAAERKLPDRLLQGPIPIRGWALESRVYAEDPLRNFLPSIGRLYDYREPSTELCADVEGVSELAQVRCDSGIQAGSDISMFYDPMICKLVTHGSTREEATALMSRALDSYVIRGPGNNLNFLRDLHRSPRWQSGAITTNFIPEEYPEGFTGVQLEVKERQQLAALALLMHHATTAHANSIDGQLSILGASSGGGRRALDLEQDLVPVIVTLGGMGGERFEVCFEAEDDSNCTPIRVTPLNEDGSSSSSSSSLVQVGDTLWERMGSPLVEASVDGQPDFVQHYEKTSEGFKLGFHGCVVDVAVRSPAEERLAAHMLPKAVVDNSKWLLCPMPGVVVSVAVEAGQVVEEGQELAVVEAMKMQNVLRAEKKAKISKVMAKAGQSLKVDEVIVEFAEEEGA